MLYYLPDQQELEDVFGEYMARGLRFEVCPETAMAGPALKVRFGKDSDVVPLLPLAPQEMQTEQAARQWLEHLRDTMVAELVRPNKRLGPHPPAPSPKGEREPDNASAAGGQGA